MAKIHERIRERREAVGLTLAQLADITGVKEATVQRWECGSIKTIKYDTIEILAHALHCTPAYLMGWEETTPAPVVESEDRYSQFMRLFETLPDDRKDEVLRYIQFLSESSEHNK